MIDKNKVHRLLGRETGEEGRRYWYWAHNRRQGYGQKAPALSQLNVRISSELVDELRKTASQCDVSLARLIESMLSHMMVELSQMQEEAATT